MRWIDALTECTDTTASATACLRAGDFATADGAVLETALVECVAQTVAAALGQRSRASGKSGAANHGMLAAVSNFRIESRAPLDRPLLIEVRELRRFGPMLQVAGVISCAGKRIAAGELTLHV